MKNLIVVFFLLPILGSAQDNKLTPEMKQLMKKEETRAKLMTKEIATLKILGISNKTTPQFGYLEKDDTIYYENKNILRISQAKDGNLNGYLIYFYDDKTIYSITKYRNSEEVDTAWTYYRTGIASLVTIYLDNGYYVDSTYYSNGKISSYRKSKKIVEVSDGGRQSWIKYDVIESRFFDEQGKEISESEFYR